MRVIGTNERTHTVSEVHREVNGVLKERFRGLFIEGEVKDFTDQYRHWYFSLVESDGRKIKASLKCVMWASDVAKLRERFKNGDVVRIFADLTVYETRGTFQARVVHMELAGEGALERAREELREKLEKEGLLREELKKPLPMFPRHIAIITSRDSAARRDVVINIRRRFPPVHLSLIHSGVGSEAAGEIAAALGRVQRMTKTPDLVIVARGGGSLQDLNAFNSETVARAIVKSTIPVVSAIGHEPDITIADYVADKRASTPSSAAELTTPHWASISEMFKGIRSDLDGLMQSSTESKQERVNQLKARFPDFSSRFNGFSMQIDHQYSALNQSKDIIFQTLKNDLEVTILKLQTARNSPVRLLETRGRELENLQKRLRHPKYQLTEIAEKLKQRTTALNIAIQQKIGVLSSTFQRLRVTSPEKKVGSLRARISRIDTQMDSTFNMQLRRRQERFESVVGQLDAISPLQTIKRGYSVVSKPDGTIWGQPIHSVKELRAGEKLVARVEDGKVDLTVDGTTEEPLPSVSDSKEDI